MELSSTKSGVEMLYCLVVWYICCFSDSVGNVIISIDVHIFQRGRLNYQAVYTLCTCLIRSPQNESRCFIYTYKIMYKSFMIYRSFMIL